MSAQSFGLDDYPSLIRWLCAYLLKLQETREFEKIEALLKVSSNCIRSSEIAADTSKEFKVLSTEYENLHYLLLTYERKSLEAKEESNLDEEIHSSLNKIEIAKNYYNSYQIVHSKA